MVQVAAHGLGLLTRLLVGKAAILYHASGEATQRWARITGRQRIEKPSQDLLGYGSLKATA